MIKTEVNITNVVVQGFGRWNDITIKYEWTVYNEDSSFTGADILEMCDIVVKIIYPTDDYNDILQYAYEFAKELQKAGNIAKLYDILASEPMIMQYKMDLKKW